MAAAALEHPRDGLAAELDWREKVDLVHEANVLRACAFERSGHADTRVVHEDIDGSAVALDAVEELSHLIGLGQVGRMSGAAEAIGELLQWSFRARDECYPRTCPREPL